MTEIENHKKTIVSTAEWDIAQNIFNKKTAAEKQAGFVISLKERLGLRHFFVCINGKLLALNHCHKNLGRGKYGKVKMALDSAGNEYAVKIEVIVATKTADDVLEERKTELAIMNKLGYLHETFGRKRELPFFDTVLNKQVRDKLYTVQKLYKDDDLRKYLQATTHLEEEKRAVAFLAMLAVQRLHDSRIIHCDIKPRNFMRDGMMVVAIDFGFALQLPEDQDVVQYKSARGTRGYRAPEIEQYKSYSFASDVYALGCMLQGFDGKPETDNNKGYKGSEEFGFKDEFLKLMTDVTPNDRPALITVMHQFYEANEFFPAANIHEFRRIVFPEIMQYHIEKELLKTQNIVFKDNNERLEFLTCIFNQAVKFNIIPKATTAIAWTDIKSLAQCAVKQYMLSQWAINLKFCSLLASAVVDCYLKIYAIVRKIKTENVGRFFAEAEQE